MNDLDERLRRGLRSSTEHVGRTDPDELTTALRSRARDDGQEDTRRRRSPRRWLVAAAALALLAGTAGVGLQRLADEGDDVVADQSPPERPEGFARWAPGWHELDTGPVPLAEPPSLAWFDGHLYAASPVSTTGLGSAGGPSAVWSYAPATREWSPLPPLPFPHGDLVATDDGLVAVGGDEPGLGSSRTPRSWATWSPGDEQWRSRGAVPAAAAFAEVGVTGPTPPSGHRSLVFTGSTVIDVSRGAVLDLRTGEATELEMPTNVVDYIHLLQATPVWTGSQLVVVSWSSKPGLAWDASGALLGEVPGPTMADSESPAEAAAVRTGEGVVLLARAGDGGQARAARYDPAVEEWSALAEVPASVHGWCPYTSATVGSVVVTQGCTVDRPETVSQLVDGRWSALPDPPRASLGTVRWLGTEDALVVWNADADTYSGAEPPAGWAAVWIPARGQGSDAGTTSEPTADSPADPAPPSSAPGVTSEATTPTTPTTAPAPQCRVDELPDLTPFLPAALQVEPQRGLGGMPDSEDLCYRHWTDPERPWVHVSQSPAAIPFGIGDERAVPGLRWGTIEDGFGLEYGIGSEGSEAEWGVMAYGLTRAEFVRFLDQMTDALPHRD